MQSFDCALCCLAFFIHVLCSVFKVQKKERTHCPKAIAIVQSCVPSKLNNVRQKRSDLGRLLEWLPTCLLRKEVIQPHLPIRLPCYDFTPVICLTFGSSLLSWVTDFGCSKLPWCDGRCVQGPGTYSPRHADPRLLAIPTSCRRVAACNPN